MDNFLKYTSIFALGIIFQMIFNIPNRPWYNDGNIYRGDTVIYKPTEKFSQFYNSCEKGKVLLIDKDLAIVKWLNCKQSTIGPKSGSIDVHNVSKLELKYK